MKNRKLHRGAVLLLSSCLLLTACKSGGREAVGVAAVDNAAEIVLEDMAGYDARAMENTEYEDAMPESPEISVMTSSSGGLKPVNIDRKLIRTVSMNLETTEFDILIECINEKVAELEGYVESSDISGSSIRYGGERSRRSAQITARIPADRLPAFITEVEANGNVTNKQESVEDVTLSYADIESRKKTLEVEQERLWALLEKAETTEAIITLESRLSEIRYQMESYESQMRLMANQVSYSTVSLYIDEVNLFTPTQEETMGQRIKRGFTENLEDVGKALTDLLVWLISHSPVLVLCLAVLFAVRLSVKHRRKKNSGEGGEGEERKKGIFQHRK